VLVRWVLGTALEIALEGGFPMADVLIDILGWPHSCQMWSEGPAEDIGVMGSIGVEAVDDSGGPSPIG